MKSAAPIIIVVALVMGGGGFFAGMKFGPSLTKTADTPQNGQFPTMPGGGQFGGANANGTRMPGGAGGARGATGGGFTSGEVLSMDEKSLTVKMPDGGSKIVFFSTSTQVMRSTTSTVTDVTAGSQVMVTGSANSDGSVTAQMINLR